MKSMVPYGGYAALALSIVLVSSRSAVSVGQATSLVRLQTVTPGVAQTGHLNISGTAIAGQFQGGGSGVTGVNAAQLGGLPLSALGVKAFPNTWTGVNTFSNASNSFTGNGAGLNGVDADRLGGILPTSYAVKSATNTWAGINNFANSNNSFAGDGSLLTSLNASNLASGTVPDALLDVGGDLKGTLSAATVSRIQGRSISPSVPTTGQVLGFSGTEWAPRTDSLALPFSGSHSNGFGPSFQVVNTSKDGIVGRSGSTGRGVSGVFGDQFVAEQTGVGVFAQASNGVAALYARYAGSGVSGYFIHEGNGAEVKVASSSGKAISTNGYLWRDYPGGQNCVAIPIAYGSVSSTGAILGGTGNFTVTRVASGAYDVLIDGEPFNSSTYTVTITPVIASPRMATVSDPGAAIRVNIWSVSGTQTDTAFQFTVFAKDPVNLG